MNHVFKVGDMAIAMPCDLDTPVLNHLKYRGEECEIVEALHPTLLIDGPDKWRTAQCYSVRFRDGTQLLAEPHELRPIPPLWEDDDAWAKRKIADVIKLNPSIFTEEPELV